MKFKVQLHVLGAKRSKGEYNGKPYDNTIVFYQADLQDGEDFVGQVGEQMRFGKSDNFVKLKDLKFPCICEALVEQVSNGNSVSMVIKDLHPIAMPKSSV